MIGASSRQWGAQQISDGGGETETSAASNDGRGSKNVGGGI